MLGQLLQLLGDVAPREDARVDRRVERAHLAADERRNGREVGDRRDVDPVRGEVLTRAVGRVQLDAKPLEIPRESGQPVAVGDREQRTHLRGSSSGRFVGAAEADPGTETIPGPRLGWHVCGRVYPAPWHTRTAS